jgi:hypothetical protein
MIGFFRLLQKLSANFISILSVDILPCFAETGSHHHLTLKMETIRFSETLAN